MAEKRGNSKEKKAKKDNKTSKPKRRFRINKKLLSFGISVTDEQVMEAIHFAYEYLKLVLEPGGAVALAAALNYSEIVNNKNVLVILSGGNIDKEIFLNSLKTKIPKM